MTNKVVLHLNPAQVEKLVEQLDTKTKLRLLRRLKQEIEAYRKEKYVKGHI